MRVRQLFDADTGTNTYLLWDPRTCEAVIIDPVREQVERDVRLIRELGLTLRYALETHVHADHVTGSGRLREILGAQVLLHRNSGARCANRLLEDGERIALGGESIEVIHTPGHTDTDISYRVGDRVFTGDALLIRGCGRTDFQSGDADALYTSVTQRLFALPEQTLVCPGHDYNGLSVSTIGEEKAHNPRLGGGRSREEFVAIMNDLRLDPPRRIEEAVPGNLHCGLAA